MKSVRQRVQVITSNCTELEDFLREGFSVGCDCSAAFASPSHLPTFPTHMDAQATKTCISKSGVPVSWRCGLFCLPILAANILVVEFGSLHSRLQSKQARSLCTCRQVSRASNSQISSPPLSRESPPNSSRFRQTFLVSFRSRHQIKC